MTTMKKLITVHYAANIEIEVPEGISDETIFDMDVARQGRPEVEEIVTKALKGALDNITWCGGEIVDIQDVES